MRTRSLILCSAAAACIIAGAGCGTSGSAAGSEESGSAPAAQATSADTTSTEAMPQSPAARKQMGFVAQDDTIEAEVLTKRESGHPHKSVVASPGKKQSKPPSAPAMKKRYYAVQIGAFRQASNLTRCVATARKRFTEPVKEFYDRGISLHRVVIGEFSSVRAASALLKTLKAQYPRDYTDAWVAELGR